MAKTSKAIAESKAEKPEEKGNRAQQQFIMLKPLERKMVSFEIRGISSLIVHRFGPKAVKQMLDQMMMSEEEKRLWKKKRPKKDAKTEFNDAKHVFSGKDGFPVTAIKKAMGRAASALGIHSTLVDAAVFVMGEKSEEYFELKYDKCIMREDWVRLPNGSPDIRYRPEYTNWRAKIRIDYRADLITADQVAALLQGAGYSTGIGEWRPEKHGPFGRFEVVTHPHLKAVK